MFKLQCEVSAKVPGLLLIITAFDWPTKSPDPQPHRESVVYCQEEDEPQNTDKPEGHYQSNLGFNKPIRRLQVFQLIQGSLSQS